MDIPAGVSRSPIDVTMPMLLRGKYKSGGRVNTHIPLDDPRNPYYVAPERETIVAA